MVLIKLVSDGCNPELVKGAEFDGIFEIPIIKKPKKFIIPKKLVPFSKMDKADKKTFAVCEYENDTEFSDLLAHLFRVHQFIVCLPLLRLRQSFGIIIRLE